MTVDEEAEILALLGGVVVNDTQGLPRQEFVTEAEETERRSLLARLLRSGRPLSQEIRNRLATLFDPDPDPAEPAAERQLVFKFRSRGRRPDHVRNTAIAMEIWTRVQNGQSVEQAVNAAMDKFGRERDTIYEIWGRFKPLIEKIESN